MIANVIKGSDQKGAFRLIRYLLSPKMETAMLADLKGHYRRGERVASSQYNFVLGQLPGENVIETANRVSDGLFSWNTQHRSKKDPPRHPFFHVIVSWHPDDQVDPAKATKLMENVLDTVMPGDRLSAIFCHADTDHLHCHAMVSTVSSTGRIFNPREDWRLWEECLEEIEVLNNFHRVTKRKSMGKDNPEGEPTEPRKKRGEYQLEKRLESLGLEDEEALSTKSLLKLKITNSLDASSSCAEFMLRLETEKIEPIFNKSNNGTITGISFLYNETPWKGSSISKNLSWNKIKQKFEISDEEILNSRTKHDHEIKIEISRKEPQSTLAGSNAFLQKLQSVLSTKPISTTTNENLAHFTVPDDLY